jgi:hypothetical protein
MHITEGINQPIPNGYPIVANTLIHNQYIIHIAEWLLNRATCMLLITENTSKSALNSYCIVTM